MIKYTLHKLPEGFIITSDELSKGSDLIMWTGDTIEHFPKQGIPNIKYGCVVESVNYSGTTNGKWKKVIAQQDQIDFSYLDILSQQRVGYFNIDYTKLCIFDERNPNYEKDERVYSLCICENCYNGNDFMISSLIYCNNLLNEKMILLNQNIWNIEATYENYWDAEPNNKIKITKIL